LDLNKENFRIEDALTVTEGGRTVAADAGLDIAIMKVEVQGFEWLPIAASTGVKAG
jgi:hypothetical protein